MRSPSRPARAQLARGTSLIALLALLIAGSPAEPAAAADKPSARTLYANGPDGRYLLDGRWLFRRDPNVKGLGEGWQRSSSAKGWSAVSVPNAWNAHDDSVASFTGGVGWYRKDFTLPTARSAYRWLVRFETVNQEATVWLNGRRLGTHRQAFEAFELDMDAGLRRTGTNRLVIRVDSRRQPTDLPPSGISTTGQPTGGWWNDAGLLREVYLRRVQDVDLENVRTVPRLSCATCAATVQVRATLRNRSSSALSVRVAGRLGTQSVSLGTVRVPARSTVGAEATVRVAKPHLWSISDPHLYDLRLTAEGGGSRAGWRTKTGIRAVTVSPQGHLQLNFKDVNLRGVGLHENSKADGFAVDDPFRLQLVTHTKELGGTVIRTHYPLHPYTLEQADRLGVLVWNEIPVYALKTENLGKPGVRERAKEMLERTIETNGNHPSVMTWSIANELSARPGGVQSAYIAGAAKLAKSLDPSRPVSLAVASYPGVGCQAAYAPLDMIGFNEYFGWYPGPNGTVFDPNNLSPFLDQMRACYPTKAIMVTEFGAEANREGPAEEKGTWGFQQDFVNFHLGLFATKPWLSGALYWALNEFRVKPNWEGGNPRPDPVIHQKGLEVWGTLAHKPAWNDTQRWFRSTVQVAP